MSNFNPCLSCGACCAYYRASFYWAEGDDAPSGTVPVEKTEPMGPFRRFMIGTANPMSRCICLQGEIGNTVFCDIYDLRASVCRDFEASWINGIQNDRCDRARKAWGLAPLEPDSHTNPDTPLRAA